MKRVWLFTLLLIFLVLSGCMYSYPKRSKTNNYYEMPFAHSNAIIKNSKFKEAQLPKSENNKLIAPINVKIWLNTTELKNRIRKLWATWTPKIKLICWNWQELELSLDSYKDLICFYTKKGTYQPKLVIDYVASLSL